MGRPAMCLTISPCFASDTAFRIVCDTHCSSGTHTKHGFGSYLFPYSFVTGKDIDGGGLIRNLRKPFTTAMSKVSLTISNQNLVKMKMES